MHEASESMLPPVGHFDFEVFGSGRDGRRRSSQFRVRCDAVALHDNELLLASVVGPETSVKALTAGLRASGRDQKRIDYSVEVGDIHNRALTRCEGGYHVYRSKLEYGLWHVLCLAKRDGFVTVLTEESIWRLLQQAPFTTPLLREWVPWLCRKLKERDLLVPLTQSGCEAGLLLADDEAIDTLVSEGVCGRHLRINGYRSLRGKATDVGAGVTGLDQYLLAYGAMLGKQAERSLDPLHVPGRDTLPT